MRPKTLTAITLAVVAHFPALVWGATCKPSDPAGTRCTLHVTELRPAQFAVGSVAADCKADDITRRDRKGKLEKYLKGEKRLVPVVVGPDGTFYMTDHHHLSTALLRADVKKKRKVLHIEILENHGDTGVTWGQFWAAMQEQNNTYNSDNKGIEHMNFALLPKDVGEMLNDPYRTLSRWVRESCGYVKAGKDQCDDIRTEHEHMAPFFMEFYWGEFFRQELPLKAADLEICKSIPYSSTCLDDEVGQLKGIYEQAMELAASDEAKTYFEDKGLDPWDYGYNPSGERKELNWGGRDNACEEVD